jgi:hypothetical protein
MQKALSSVIETRQLSTRRLAQSSTARMANMSPAEPTCPVIRPVQNSAATSPIPAALPTAAWINPPKLLVAGSVSEDLGQ